MLSEALLREHKGIINTPPCLWSPLTWLVPTTPPSLMLTTKVMGGDQVKILSWYDNEWGYSQRVVDLAEIVAQRWASDPRLQFS